MTNVLVVSCSIMIFSFVVVIICRRQSPIMPRSPSPRRQGRYNHHGRYHDGPGFSDTVSNVVEIQRHTHHPHALQYNHRHKIRGTGDNSDQRKPRCNEHKFFHYDSELCFMLVIPKPVSLSRCLLSAWNTANTASLYLFYHRITDVPPFSWCYFYYIIIINYY